MNITPALFVEALRDWGVDATPYEPDGKPWWQWTTAGGWDPSHGGVLHHHTGDVKGNTRLLDRADAQAGMLRTLRIGRGGANPLDGPLCHTAPAMVPGTTRARVWLVGWGNVNHAGRGSATAARLLAGGFGLPTGTWQPGTDAVDGNEFLYGQEYLHPGDDTPWPDALLEAGHRSGLAIGELHGWSHPALRQLEHREWTRRKPDRSWTGHVRIACQSLSKPATTEEDPMAGITLDDIRKTVREELAAAADDISKAVAAAVWADPDLRNPDPKYDGPGFKITPAMALGGSYRAGRNAATGAQVAAVVEAAVAKALTPQGTP